MPYYSHLQAGLPCPSCATVVVDMLWFQWGYTSGEFPYQPEIYTIGDTIKWGRCNEGSIFSWAYFYQSDVLVGANIGDPAISDLAVRDVATFYWEKPEQRRRCDNCQLPLDGAAIEIRDHVIRRAWVYSSQELNNVSERFMIHQGEQRTPLYIAMPEWNDHLMASVFDCDAKREQIPCGTVPERNS